MGLSENPENPGQPPVDGVAPPGGEHASATEVGHHEGAKAHFAAAALHASVSEQHMIAAAAHVQGEHDLACYYAKVVGGDSERAYELSRRAIVLSTE